jgi:hypothetical protein
VLLASGTLSPIDALLTQLFAGSGLERSSAVHPWQPPPTAPSISNPPSFATKHQQQHYHGALASSASSLGSSAASCRIMLNFSADAPAPLLVGTLPEPQPPPQAAGAAGMPETMTSTRTRAETEAKAGVGTAIMGEAMTSTNRALSTAGCHLDPPPSGAGRCLQPVRPAHADPASVLASSDAVSGTPMAPPRPHPGLPLAGSPGTPISDAAVSGARCPVSSAITHRGCREPPAAHAITHRGCREPPAAHAATSACHSAGTPRRPVLHYACGHVVRPEQVRQCYHLCHSERGQCVVKCDCVSAASRGLPL